jgi:hypothetical protein
MRPLLICAASSGVEVAGAGTIATKLGFPEFLP